jgi:two-component system, NtrC family, response regulator GlrR
MSDDVGSLAAAGLIGHSEAFLRAVEAIVRVARVDVPVLLWGETGTGKELAARAIHYLSGRNGRAFVPVDCGALPDTLFAGELFGHVRGAFTDARQDTCGLVAQADGGTLMFDEIHVLAHSSQAALLRFLQDFQFRPLGGRQPRRADVRIVAATNRDLAKEAELGAFRADLLYRLNVATIRMPSLRERADDIPELVESCIARFCARYGRAPCRFDAASLAWMQAQPWHGNVRELDNFVQRCLLAFDGAVAHVEADGLAEPQPATLSIPPFNQARAQVLDAFETRYLRQVLSENHGNVTAAARQACKERRVFGRLLKKHGIERDDYL